MCCVSYNDEPHPMPEHIHTYGFASRAFFLVKFKACSKGNTSLGILGFQSDFRKHTPRNMPGMCHGQDSLKLLPSGNLLQFAIEAMAQSK